MKTVNEVSKLSGVSVRTLHHYDSIGLLKPTKVTEAGYRLYDEVALARLQSVLMFRELQFSLKEIKEILDSPTFDYNKALEQQIDLLELKQKHLGELIRYARQLEKGELKMNFKAFNHNELEQYKAEAKARWGKTDAYREYEQRGEQGGADFSEKMMEIFAEFGALQKLSPMDDMVQEKVKKLQQFITENFYTCTKKILATLGLMYVSDERFKENIDNAGGEGTAEFVSHAIEIYCSK